MRVRATLLLPLFVAPALPAQDASSPPPMAAKPAPLFASHQTLALTLEADFGTIFKERDQESQYHPAKLTFPGADGGPKTLDITVRTRGNFRLQPRICGFPPLRLNFPKQGTEGTVFEGQDKIKLGTHCQDKRDQYEQITVLEYLVYRTYGLLTDKGLQIRLARITYADAAGKRDTLTRYAFLLEDEDAMAARMGGKIFQQEEIHDENTDIEQMTLTAVFQYLIGNTDWSVWALHNIVLVEMPGAVFPTAVPYDFDWAGVISAPYARPDEKLPIRSVRTRLYRGYCRVREELAPVFARFNQKKDEIYALYQNQDGLTDETKKKTLAYFDEFYQTINDPRSVEREILRKCRQ